MSAQHADQAAVDLASRKCRLVVKNQHVQWIAVIPFGSWKQAEIVGEDHAFGHYFRKFHPAGFFIELVFVATAAWRLNKNLHLAESIFLLILVFLLDWHTDADRQLARRDVALSNAG